MNWNQALNLILLNITIGLHLNPRSQFRFVREVPPYQCFRYGFNGSAGFKIQIGRNDFVESPILMLERIHQTAMQQNAGVYNKRVIQFLYPNILNSRPCIVQAIGKIFELSGVARPINRFEYQLL